MNDIPSEQETHKTPETPQAAKLPSAYDSTLLGATVSIHEPDRFVYSLRKLIRFEMSRNECGASEARGIVARDFITPLAREYGHMAPVFVDDELVQGSIQDTEKHIIIVPKQFNGNRK